MTRRARAPADGPNTTIATVAPRVTKPSVIVFACAAFARNNTYPTTIAWLGKDMSVFATCSAVVFEIRRAILPAEGAYAFVA